MGTSAAGEFALDSFQVDAIAAFDAGESVLVSAPTGAGKTVIAEHAIAKMLASGERIFYTSPIKALANQKFRDFGRRFGADNIGLLTGDITIQGDAPVVIMTTEVLRNMLYERSGRIPNLGCVVLDEVHYLQDPQRGPVWEEVLLNLPGHVRTVSLSATVSNVEEFAEWLRTVRGPTRLIDEKTRPVPLRHELAVLNRASHQIERVRLLRGSKIAPEALRYRAASRAKTGRDRHRRGAQQQSDKGEWGPPPRARLVDDLVADGEGPLICFIFSRAGCEEAVEQCRRAGLRYTDDDEADLLAAILHDATAEIDDDDWYSLALDDWQESFEAGITSHHAGLIPAVKEAVEQAFAQGLISVVFATETLALGVNLPARTVVIERLVKFNGETHELLTPLEFTQLTGRAGRRGLDTEGTAVSCWSPTVGVEAVAELAASVDFPLRSAFSSNYNMVANLIRHTDRASARAFVGRSFAQFQQDRRVVAAEAHHRGLESEMAAIAEEIACEHGDVRAWLSEQHRRAQADDEELGQLRPGDVIDHGGGAVIVSVAHRGRGVVVRTIDGTGRISSHRSGELASPIRVVGHERLPAGLAPTDHETVVWVRGVLAENSTTPVAGVGSCPDLGRHLDAVRRVEQLERKLAKQRSRHERRQSALQREFDLVTEILVERGFVTDWRLTAKGHLLTNVHGEAEAALAEALASGVFDRLSAPELAATLSALAYEPRGTTPAPSFRWPSPAVRRATSSLQQIARSFRTIEHARLDHFLTREPDPSFVATVYGWAAGDSLDVVLDDDVTGGDFVRSMRQVVDLCRQIGSVADPSLRATASDAVFCIDRGVVRSARDLVAAGDEEVREPVDAD